MKTLFIVEDGRYPLATPRLILGGEVDTNQSRLDGKEILKPLASDGRAPMPPDAEEMASRLHYRA